MTGFEDSYLGRLRKLVGSRLVLMPAANCVVQRADGLVLLHRRGDSGLWSVPGGFAEEGESITDTAIREFEEETGVRPIEPVAWGHSSDPGHERLLYPNGDVVQSFAMKFWATRWSGEPKADGTESLDLGWFDPETLPPDMSPSAAREIGYWLAYRRTGAFQVY
jgi:ADP-ribose pyrophosphatase YjhB (NUDIX family)